MIRLLVLFVALFGFMVVEARRAAANERTQRARGGIEPKHDVYPAMQVAYPGIFFAMIAEGLFRPEPSRVVLAAGVVVFVLGKLLKWWAITALGSVLDVPGRRGARFDARRRGAVPLPSPSELRRRVW